MVNSMTCLITVGEKEGRSNVPLAMPLPRCGETILHTLQATLLHCSTRCLAHDVVHLHYFVLVTVHNTIDASNVPLSPI